MEGIRRDGRQFPRKETSTAGQEEVDIAAFGNVVIALMRDQDTEAQMHQTSSTWGYPETADDIASGSGGSVSPDSGEMWRSGCAKKPGLGR